jgi:hypothetical protein
VFDLDPPDVAHFGEACRHALDLRELLEGELGLTAYVKTTVTRMRRGGRQAWLLVRKADEFADGDPVETSPKSVKSGKTIGQLDTPNSKRPAG